MMRVVWFTLVVATTSASADPVCTRDAVKRVRKRAEALVKAKHYQAAVDELNKVECHLAYDQPADLQAQLAWRLADLTWALHAAGNDSACYDIAAREVTTYAGNAAAILEQGRVLDALAANADVCYRAEATKRGDFADATRCTLVDDALGVPTSALASGDRAACLVIEPGATNPQEMAFECGDVTLVRLTSAGRITRTTLTLPEDSNLADGGVCCNLHDVQFARRGNTFAFLAKTGGRNCDGGTASGSEEEVHELARDGKTLGVVHSLDVAYH